jgi:hypothetical protein
MPIIAACNRSRTTCSVGLCLVALVGLALAGCAIFDRSEPQATPEQLQAKSFAAARDCDLAYPPTDRKAAVERAKCHTAAWEILRPTMVYPDILDALIAKRIAIARQVERGDLTIAQGNDAISKARAEAAAEEQRRRGAAAPEGAAKSIASTPQ